MKIGNLIRICFYGLLILFGLVFVAAGIAKIKDGLQSSIISIISGLIFSLFSLRNLVFCIMTLKCEEEDLE